MASISISFWIGIAASGGLSLSGCGGDAEPPTDDAELRGACTDAERVGSFEATLHDVFTSVQGKVEDGVTPARVPEVVDSAVVADGSCRLLRPPTLFCDPACASGTTCDASGACVPTPAAVSVGVVTVDGLAAPVEMTASAPVFFYTHTGALDHPGFADGDAIRLRASGDGAVTPFSLGARGVAALSVSATSMALEAGAVSRLEWTAGTGEASSIHIDLNIAQHGGNPGAIQCEVADTGAFELPVSLTDQLLAFGFSGFPSVTVTRRSADSTTTELGCVQLLVQSAVVLDVEIPGLISCSGDEDCPAGQMCQADLTCG